MNDEIDWIDDSEDEEDGFEDTPSSIRGLLNALEVFLNETLDDDARGNVFLSKNGDGVAVNMLIGAAFELADPEINQVNIIVSPTDRSLLGSTGVSMDVRIDDETNDGYEAPVEERESSRYSAFDAARDML